jgi:membrane protein implicated in regulation of membrane protease activity
MGLNGIGDAGWWLIAALALGIAELVVPGVFLVFLAIAAAITGVIALVVPDLGLGGELVAFAIWSAVAVLIGRRWYHQYPVPTSDPLLNDRAARMVGSEVRVIEAIVDGHGRVRVGDGEWPATGPDLPAGARVRIAAVEGGVVRVAAPGE